MSLIFGNLTNQFVEFQTVTTLADRGEPGFAERLPEVAAAFRKVAAEDAVWLVVIGEQILFSSIQRPTVSTGCGMLTATFIYMYVWVHTGEVNAKRLRERYLKAVLRQDVAFFDKVGAGEVATRIQTDTRRLTPSIRRVRLTCPICRLGSTRHIGKSRPGRQLYSGLLLRLYHRPHP